MPKSSEHSDVLKTIAELEVVLRQDPASLEFVRLADAYTRASRFAEAIEVAEHGLSSHPELAAGHVALGRALFGSNKLARAIKVLEKAVSLPEGGSEPYRLLGEILLRREAADQAVALLERAVAKGFKDRAIQSLLERACAALEAQQTTVVDPFGIGSRGNRSMAVAGTIGSSGLNERPVRRTLRYAVEQPAQPMVVDEEATERVNVNELRAAHEAELKTQPGNAADPEATPPPDWSSIGNEWEHELDARSDGFVESDSETSGAFVPRSVRLPSAPKAGAVASQEAELDKTPLLERREVKAAPDGPAQGPVSLIPTQAEAKEQAEEQEEEQEEVNEQAEVQGSLATESDLISDLVSDLVEVEAAEPPEEEAAAGGDAGEASADDSEGEERLLDEPPWPGMESAAAGRLGLAAPDEAPSALYVPTKARSRWVWLIVGSLCCLALGGAGALFWHKHRAGAAVRGALALAAQAYRTGTLQAFNTAASRLAEVRALGYEEASLVDAADAVAALTWLLYADGQRAPRLVGGSQSFAGGLARALVELTHGACEKAKSWLAASAPEGKPEQAMRALALAWAESCGGNDEAARASVSQALELDPGLANAALLQGDLARERGALEEAARAYRRAPAHALASLGLAAVLLQQGQPEDEAVRRALAQPGDSPVAKAWQALLRAEVGLRGAGDQRRAAQELRLALAAPPPRSSLLFHGIEALLLAGELDAALALREQLRSIRARADGPLRMLDAELALARGLEARALSLLEEGEWPPRGKLLRAEALLALGKLREASSSVADVPGDEAQSIGLAATLLQDPKRSLAPLEVLARRVPRARLLLAQLRLSRGDPRGARQEAQQLAEKLAFAAPARLVLARAQIEEKDVAGALGTLKALGEQHLAARELLGLLQLNQGRQRESLQILSSVQRQGRETLPLAQAQAQAHALENHPIEASAARELAGRLGATPAQLEMLTGFVRLAQGKADEAASLLERAEPRPPTLVALGQAYFQAGKVAAAERTFSQLLVDSNSPLAHLWLGRLQLERKERGARDHFEEALKGAQAGPDVLTSVVVEAHVGLARYVILHKQNAAQAIEHLLTATRLDPAHAMGYCLLGEAYLAQRQFKLAREALEKSIALNRQEPTAYYLLGMQARLKTEQARRVLSRFLELEPRSARATQARRKLSRLR